MKTVPATEAKNRLGAILDQAQTEPVIIRRQDRDIAVVLSMAEYQRLKTANVRDLLDLADRMAAQASAKGMDERKLNEILGTNGA